MLGIPLSRLAEATNQLDLNNLKESKISIQTSGKTELKILENAFNSMIQSLLIAKEQIQSGYQHLRQVLDLVPHPIFAKNRAGIFLMANQAFGDQYHKTDDEITGSRQGDIHKNKKDVAIFLQDDLEVINTGQRKMIPEENFVDNEGIFHVQQVYKIPFDYEGQKSL